MRFVKRDWTNITRGFACAAAMCAVLTGGTAHAMHAVEVAAPVAGQPSPAVVEDQTKDDLLNGLDKLGANAKERNEVNLDKSMMALTVGRRSGHAGDLSQKMDLITVRNYEFATKGMYSKGDLDQLRKRLDGNGWSHIVRNESEGETSDIAVKATPDGFLSDMVILSAEPREVNIVHLRGHFQMEDVNGAIGATMGITRGAGAGAMGMLAPLGAAGAYSRSGTHAAPAVAPVPVPPARTGAPKPAAVPPAPAAPPL